jgi:hypothetical protein
MKSDQDAAIQNQKVFVMLRDVLKLQKSYLYAVETHNEAQSNFNNAKSSTNQTALDRARTRLQAFQLFIKELKLPIETY